MIRRLFLGSQPFLVVADPQLIKDVMVKDFNVFVNRRTFKMGDPILDRALSVVEDEEWKRLRSVVSIQWQGIVKYLGITKIECCKISPTFTSGKMKKMHKLVEQCVHTLDKKLENVAKTQEEIEMKKLMGDYSMDVIASCAFATKTDTHNDPNNPFVRNAIKIFTPQIWRSILFIGLRPLMKLLNIPVVNPEPMNFFRSAVCPLICKGLTNFNFWFNDL